MEPPDRAEVSHPAGHILITTDLSALIIIAVFVYPVCSVLIAIGSVLLPYCYLEAAPSGSKNHQQPGLVRSTLVPGFGVCFWTRWTSSQPAVFQCVFRIHRSRSSVRPEQDRMETAALIGPHVHYLLMDTYSSMALALALASAPLCPSLGNQTISP